MRQHMRPRGVLRFPDPAGPREDFVDSPLLLLSDERPPQHLKLALICSRGQIPNATPAKFRRRISGQPRTSRVREHIVSVVVRDQCRERQSINQPTNRSEGIPSFATTHLARQAAENCEGSGGGAHLRPRVTIAGRRASANSKVTGTSTALPAS